MKKIRTAIVAVVFGAMALSLILLTSERGYFYTVELQATQPTPSSVTPPHPPTANQGWVGNSIHDKDPAYESKGVSSGREARSGYGQLMGASTAGALLNGISRTTSPVKETVGVQASVFEYCTRVNLLAAKLQPQPKVPQEKSPLSSERSSVRFCADLPQRTSEDLQKLWDQALANGDSRAIAREKWLLYAKSFTSDVPGLQSAGVSAEVSAMLVAPARLDADVLVALQRAISTQDPIAILTFGPLLFQNSASDHIVFSATQTPFADSSPFIWDLLACDFGAPCGVDNVTVVTACAARGICDVSSLDEYMRKHVFSATERALYDANRELFVSAIRTGDWSFLNVARSNVTAMPRNIYVGPLRFRLPR